MTSEHDTTGGSDRSGTDDAYEALPGSLGRGLRRMRRGTLLYGAWTMVTFERVWPPLAFAVLIGAAFLIFALFDVAPALPGWLHMTLLVGLLMALLVAIWRPLSRVVLPRRVSVHRRLEEDSALRHRPFEAVGDRLAGQPDETARAVFDLHQRRAQSTLDALRPTRLRALRGPVPLWVKGAALMILVLALVDARGEYGERLLRAVTPALAAEIEILPASLDVWIDPPVYTSRAPVFLANAASDAAPVDAVVEAASVPMPAQVPAVPVGSAIIAQVDGGPGQPELLIGDTVIPFDSVRADAYRVSHPLPEAVPLAGGPGTVAVEIRQGGATLGAWTIEAIPDLAPEIEFAGPLQRTGRAGFRITYEASDDYGITGGRLVISRAGVTRGVGDFDTARPSEVIELPVTVPGGGGEGAAYFDLTAHPWAGLEVDLRLEATDAAEQVGSSEPMTATLPERVFQHPVARFLAAQRKRLTIEPEAAREVAVMLFQLRGAPQRFGHDTTVYLGVSSAARRLINPRYATLEGIRGVQALLWDLALRIEDGEVSIAARDLREAQEALMDALNRDASDQELAQLMDQLEQAMERFLDALEQQAMNGDLPEEQMQPMDPSQQVSRGDLREMMERLRDLSRTGARDAAREMLSRMQQMMENLQAGRQMQQQMDSRTEQAMQQLRDLDRLMQQQQSLLDDTYQRQRGRDQLGREAPNQPHFGQQPGEQGQQGQGRGEQGRQGRGQNGQGQGEGLSTRQEALRRILGEIMRGIGEANGQIPGPLGQAERSMNSSRQALDQGGLGQSVQQQAEALDQLRQGAQAMADQLMEQFGGQAGDGQQAGPAGGDQRDPLGRRQDQLGVGRDTSDVEIPTEVETQRARRILDELRRRSNDRQRPVLELDYIDRLLDRF